MHQSIDLMIYIGIFFAVLLIGGAVLTAAQALWRTLAPRHYRRCAVLFWRWIYK